MNDYKIEVCSYYKPQTFDYSKKPNIKQLNYVTEYRFAGKGFLKFEDVDLDYCKESKLEVVGGIPVSEWRNIGTRKLEDDSQREMIKKYVEVLKQKDSNEGNKHLITKYDWKKRKEDRIPWYDFSTWTFVRHHV